MKKAPPKIRNLYASVLYLGVCLDFLGCGQSLTGTYTGTETVTINGVSQASSQVTVSLTQINNDVTGGSWTSTFGTGTFTGRPSGEMTLPYSLIQVYPGTAVGITLSTAQALPCGTYTGKLNITYSQITGRLDLTQAAAVPAIIALPSITLACPMTRTISVTR